MYQYEMVLSYVILIFKKIMIVRVLGQKNKLFISENSCMTVACWLIIIKEGDVSGESHNEIRPTESRWDSFESQYIFHEVALGALVVRPLATGPEVRGFRPSRDRCIFKGDKNL